MAAARKPRHAARPQAGKSASTASRTRAALPSRVPADRKFYLGCTAPRAARHSHIRPQLHRQRQILLTPRAKPKPLGSEKIFRSHCAFPDCQIPPTPAHMRGFFWLCKIIVPAVGGWLPTRKLGFRVAVIHPKPRGLDVLGCTGRSLSASEITRLPRPSRSSGPIAGSASSSSSRNTPGRLTASCPYPAAMRVASPDSQ
jgi:hypothetical protein